MSLNIGVSHSQTFEAGFRKVADGTTNVTFQDLEGRLLRKTGALIRWARANDLLISFGPLVAHTCTTFNYMDSSSDSARQE